MLPFSVLSAPQANLKPGPRLSGTITVISFGLLVGACAPEDNRQAEDSGSIAWMDTGLQAESGVPKDANDPQPSLMVDPAIIDLGQMCGVQTEEVELSNDGPGTLEIQGILIEGQDWGISGLPSSLLIAPGEIQQLQITGGQGPGTLIIQSNDPQRHRIEVPLDAEAMQCPHITATK